MGVGYGFLNGQAPVVVMGPLRSGTTLFRLMLNSHPEIENSGEFDYIFDHIHPRNGGIAIDRRQMELERPFEEFAAIVRPDMSDEDYFQTLLDHFFRTTKPVKSINIHRNIFTLNTLFPGLKYIHLTRDPRPVALSHIGMGWAGNCYHGIDHWIETESHWEEFRKQLPPENCLEISYEELLRDTENCLRHVCGFIGVNYDPAMLEYHKVSTYEPLSPDNADRWKRSHPIRYRKYIDHKLLNTPIFAKYREAYAVDMVARPGPVKLLEMKIDNMIRKNLFNIRRYGLGLVATEKLSRFLGARSAHENVQRKMNRISKDYVK